MVSMSNAEDTGMPLPPPTFTFLVLSLSTQAEMQLGLVRFDEAEKPEVNLPLARHTLDMMAMLKEKTKGNLSPAEQELINTVLSGLRMAYVKAMEGKK